MQVSHASDHITHAVIGGKKQIDFGISESAEFFQILSSALYKDPTLAMIRETICNGWDAHIDSQRTDLPLVITLTDEKLIIQDRGKGIPDHLIGPIYAVYGASTKKNDGRQTGGFGLGCKSPFAYTDHFEVVSCHMGKRTIYNMSKSSAEVMGKPSIVPIATFDTDITGITVTIPLKGDHNDRRLESLIRQVVYNGDIFATLNGNVLNTIKLNETDNGFVLINERAGRDDQNPTTQFDKSRIWVRYGNVVYPVEDNQSYSALFKKSEGLMANHYSCRLVLLAPPDSISITPSRESITMSDISIATITELLTKFLAAFYRNQMVVRRRDEIVHEYVDKAAAEPGMLSQKIVVGEWNVPGVPVSMGTQVLRSTEDYAMLEVLLRYSGRGRHSSSLKSSEWVHHFTRYLAGMIKAEQLPRGLTQTWMRVAQRYRDHLHSPHHNWGAEEVKATTRWWQDRILSPLVRKAKAALPDFNIDKLSYKSDNLLRTYNDHYSSYSREKEKIYTVRDVRLQCHTSNLKHLLTTSVVLCHNAEQLSRRIRNIIKSNLGSGSFLHDSYFVYEVSRKKGCDEAALAAFQSIQGIEVINLMGRTDSEEEVYQDRMKLINKMRADAAAGKVIEPRLLKKARPGITSYATLLDDANQRIDTEQLTENLDPVRLKEPEFIEIVSMGKDARHRTKNFEGKVAYAIGKLYGTLGGVTNKSDVFARYQKDKGVKNLSEFVLDKILTDMQTSPTLLAYREVSVTKMEEYLTDHGSYPRNHQAKNIFTLMLANDTLLKLLPGFTRLSDDDAYRMIIWEHLKEDWQHRKNEDVQKITKEDADVKLKPEITEFLDGLLSNKFLGLVDTDETVKALKRNRKDPAAVDKIVAFVTTIIS